MFNKHCNSKKHIQRLKHIDELYQCICGKRYLSKSGYNTHKRKCNEYKQTQTNETKYQIIENDNTTTSTYYITDLMNHITNKKLDEDIDNNTIFTFMKAQYNHLLQITKEMNELKSHIKNLEQKQNEQPIHNTIIENHQTNNINIDIDIDIDKFIVKNYTNAKNINDVIDEIPFGEKELQYMISNGSLYNTIQECFMKHILNMTQSLRPLHYISGKEHDFYIMIKHNDIWNKLYFESKNQVTELLEPDVHKQNIMNNTIVNVSKLLKDIETNNDMCNEVIYNQELDIQEYPDGVILYVKSHAIEKVKEYFIEKIIQKINKTNIHVNNYYKDKYNIVSGDEDSDNEINAMKYENHYYEMLEVIKILGEYNSMTNKPKIINKIINKLLITVNFI